MDAAFTFVLVLLAFAGGVWVGRTL